MSAEGPLLEGLTRRLAECPAEFLAEPLIGQLGVVHVDAVVADLLQALAGTPDPVSHNVLLGNADQQHRNRLSLTLVTCWLLYDPWFRARGDLGETVARLLADRVLDDLAALVPAARFVLEPDQREELVRLCLKELGLRPAGETDAQADDRLVTLSTVERRRVMEAARTAEARAQAVREAMRQQAAREAAARMTRE